MKTQIITLLWCCFSILGFSQSITDIEYFYNTDPGFGNGTAIIVDTGTTTQIVSLPVGNTLTGFNTLYIRAKDNAGVWGLYDSRVFYITELEVAASNIATAEYFYNSDPGFGNATAITLNTGTQTLALPVGNTLTGFNSLYIRTQDDLGVWSLYDRRIFYIAETGPGSGASNIAAAEYFFNDNDLGFGNATSIPVNTNTGELTQILSLPVNSLDGFNTLYVRTQDDLGVWSLYDKRLFYVSKDLVIANITGAEYFYDTDPGFGNGTAAIITPTGNPDEYTIELATTDVTCDFHDFYIRLQNTDGTWSLYDYRLDVEVFDNADPTIVVFPNITAELDASGQASITITDVDDGTFDDCDLVSVVLNQTQFDYTCANLGANTVTITATDAEAKVSTEDITVTVVDNINPVAVSKNITVQLDGNGNVTITPAQIENGSTDNCSVTGFSLDISSFTCANLGANTVDLTVSDSSGNTNTTSATVTVQDNINPVAITKAFTAQLDASGNVTITANDVDNSSTDNCAVTSRSLDVPSFTCANLGTNTVMLTVGDVSGNTNTASATVTVEDSVNPTAVTQNITVQLDATGNASIIASQIENSSTDNCSVTGFSLDVSSFTCANLGANTVNLTVSDSSGNTNSASATVTVQDNINPVAITSAFTAQLDASGNVTITPDDVDNSSTDNCVVTSKSLDVSSFTCANLGANTVMLTVEDASGNTNTAAATVTIEDSVNPTVVTQNITVQLDASGNASITASQIENGSSDNCAMASSSLDITSFTCANLGSNTVTLSVNDTSGNTGTNTATVTVEDNINPVAITQAFTAQLDASGNVTITADDVDNSSTDNCAVTIKSLDVSSFTCANLGPNTVMLTVEDASGNSNTASATVTVEDSVNPIAIGQDITRDLAGNASVTIVANEVDNGSLDNCSTPTLSIDVDTFTAIGVYPVVLTATDGSTNQHSVTVMVTIEDSSLGIEEFEISAKNILLYPNPSKGDLFISTKLIIDSVDIYDVDGRHINRVVKPGTQIDFERISSGMYFLKFKIENTFVTKRIVKE
tara:strand:- start:170 stop:3304 length:3135 start_codon:yes stop_codon:yes gene_type:complete